MDIVRHWRLKSARSKLLAVRRGKKVYLPKDGAKGISELSEIGIEDDWMNFGPGNELGSGGNGNSESVGTLGDGIDQEIETSGSPERRGW